jgi:hypothetical protein
MKKLTLQTLTLTNFKGQSFTLETHGKNVDVFGQNATGKTTLYDALCWLLFGKDSDFKTDFEIKNLYVDGTCEHNLNHEVNGLFRWDGKVIELKKIYSEIWTKKRGSASKEMTGHTTDHFIDAVPVNKKDFQAYIQEIATEEQFKLLTSPFYFAEKMKWQDRRGLVMSLCGDVSDNDVMAGDSKFNPLTAILNGRKIDDHKKVIAARRKELNDFLEKIPIRIDEVVKGMPDISGINHLAEIDKVNKWSVELDQIESQISALRNNGAMAELQKDLALAEVELITAESVVTEKHNSDRRTTQDRLNKLKNDLAVMDAKIQQNVFEIGRRKEDKVFLESVIGGLKAEWFALKAGDTEFKASVKKGECTCAACGDVHNIPAEKLASIIALHNENLSNDLASNERIGKAKKQMLIDVENKIVSMGNANTVISQDELPVIEEISRIEASLHDPDASLLKMIIDNSAPVSEAREKVALINNRIQMEKEGVQDNSKVVELSEKAGQLKTDIENSRQKISLVELSIKAQDRKKELEAEQLQVAAEFEKLEGELFLIDEFTRSKVAKLEDKINGMFSMARFKMFSEQINGGLSECCEVTYNGVPFTTSLNNGARINVGLDIINTISKAHGLSLPVFIDNAESVTELFSVDAQVIRLIVSADDKVLRVEAATDDMQKAA